MSTPAARRASGRARRLYSDGTNSGGGKERHFALGENGDPTRNIRVMFDDVFVDADLE